MLLYFLSKKKNLELKFTRPENLYFFLFYYVHPSFSTTVDFSLIKSIIIDNYTHYLNDIIINYFTTYNFLRHTPRRICIPPHQRKKEKRKRLKRIFYSSSIYMVYHFNSSIKSTRVQLSSFVHSSPAHRK